jgi:hypothetical protein
VAYANVQNSGKVRTNTAAGLSWTPGAAPTLNNLLTHQSWGWDASPGYTPGATDARDSSGTPKNYTLDASLGGIAGHTNFGVACYSLVVPSGLTTPLRNANTGVDTLVGYFAEWSGNATSSVVDATNTASGSASTPQNGPSLTTGANAGMVLSTLVIDVGSVAEAGTNFVNDAIETDNSTWQGGAAGHRFTSVASTTLNDQFTFAGGAPWYEAVIVSYNLPAGGGFDPSTVPPLAATHALPSVPTPIGY